MLGLQRGGRAWPVENAGTFSTLRDARARRDFVVAEIALGRNPGETLRSPLEAPQRTLGDFFAVWGQPLDTKHAASASAKRGEQVYVWVNGKRYTGDPAKIPLTAHADIVVQVGPPFAKPVAFTNWGAL